MLWSISNSLLNDVSSWRNVVGRFDTFTSNLSSHLVVGGFLTGTGSPVIGWSIVGLSILLSGRGTSVLLLTTVVSELLLVPASSELFLSSASSKLFLASTISELLLGSVRFILLLSHIVGSFGTNLLNSDLLLLSSDSLSL